jgi:hypothetical protein
VGQIRRVRGRPDRPMASGPTPRRADSSGIRLASYRTRYLRDFVEKDAGIGGNLESLASFLGEDGPPSNRPWTRPSPSRSARNPRTRRDAVFQPRRSDPSRRRSSGAVRPPDRHPVADGATPASVPLLDRQPSSRSDRSGYHARRYELPDPTRRVTPRVVPSLSDRVRAGGRRVQSSLRPASDGRDRDRHPEGPTRFRRASAIRITARPASR